MNYRIVHSDLINLGIVFLEQSEERAFLNRVNDEFAYLVGIEALNWAKENNNESEDLTMKGVWKLFEKDMEKCSEIVETVRTRIMLNLIERRKQLLGGNNKQGICFTKDDSEDNIEVPQQRPCTGKMIIE